MIFCRSHAGSTTSTYGEVLQRPEFDAARRCGKTGGKGIFVVFTDLYLCAKAVDHIV